MANHFHHAIPIPGRAGVGLAPGGHFLVADDVVPIGLNLRVPWENHLPAQQGDLLVTLPPKTRPFEMLVSRKSGKGFRDEKKALFGKRKSFRFCMKRSEASSRYRKSAASMESANRAFYRWRKKYGGNAGG